MKNNERIAKLEEKGYQGLFVVKKPIFYKMLEILEELYNKAHIRSAFCLSYVPEKYDCKNIIFSL